MVVFLFFADVDLLWVFYYFLRSGCWSLVVLPFSCASFFLFLGVVLFYFPLHADFPEKSLVTKDTPSEKRYPE